MVIKERTGEDIKIPSVQELRDNHDCENKTFRVESDEGIVFNHLLSTDLYRTYCVKHICNKCNEMVCLEMCNTEFEGDEQSYIDEWNN